MKNSVPVFDIFKGFSDKNAMWVERVSGLAAAQERMGKIAAEVPGPYFIFDLMNHTVLAKHVPSNAPPTNGYNVFRKLDDGRSLKIGWRRDMDEAMRLAAHLMENWPAEYSIQLAKSHDVSDEEASIA